MQRKTLFHILLVITYIFAGLTAFSYLLMALMLPTLQQLYADNSTLQQLYANNSTLQQLYADNSTLVPEQFSVMMQQMIDTPRGYYIGAGLLYLLELLGAAFMWNLRWTGFHCYTLARLLLLLLPLLFLGRGFVGIGDIMMALLFIAVYYLLMRQLSAEQSEPPEEG